MSDLVAFLRGFAEDHEPDGWPAIRMRQVTELCDMVESLRHQLADEKMCHAETREQLAAGQHYAQQLREALEIIRQDEVDPHTMAVLALSEPHDTSALDTITKPLHFRIEELEAVIKSHGIPVKTYAGGEAHYCTKEEA